MVFEIWYFIFWYCGQDFVFYIQGLTPNPQTRNTAFRKENIMSTEPVEYLADLLPDGHLSIPEKIRKKLERVSKKKSEFILIWKLKK